MTPAVAIIILNWNGWQDTIECLESVFQINYPYYTVILIDNGSEDNSLEKIRAYCAGEIQVESPFFEYNSANKPITIFEYSRQEAEGGSGIDGTQHIPSNKKLILIKNEHNFGFAEGNNIGIYCALKKFNPDFILLLNNDTVIDSNLLGPLIEDMKKDANIALIQPKILSYITSRIDNTGIECDIFGATKARGESEEDTGLFDHLKKTGFFYASGACVLISKSFIQEKNSKEVFDKFLFAYHDDVDLSWEARLLGYEIAYCPQSTCYHKGSKTAGVFNPNKIFWVIKNRNRVLIKNYSLKNLLWILPISLLIEFFHSILDSLYHREYKFFIAFLNGIWWDIKNFRNTLVYRKDIQSRRKIQDRQIMESMISYSIEIDFIMKRISTIIK